MLRDLITYANSRQSRWFSLLKILIADQPEKPFPQSEYNVNGPDFNKSELLPAIAQDASSGTVLMLAYMNREAYEETLKTGRVCYYSRSRQKLWRKGEESGNVQELVSIALDCDADTLLVKVNQIGGAACHEGYQSCFFRKVDPATKEISVVSERVFDPDDVYQKGES